MELCFVDNGPSRLKRVTWSSNGIRNLCVFADRLLAQYVNNGKSIETISANLEHTFPDHKVELKLLVLFKRVMISYRSNCFITAKHLLQEYTDLLTATTEFELFDAMRVYLQTALYRARGDSESLRAILPGALAYTQKRSNLPLPQLPYICYSRQLRPFFKRRMFVNCESKHRLFFQFGLLSV